MASASTSDMDGVASFHEKEQYAEMEKWLDDHPDFAHDYFARKGSRTMIDAWLFNHALSQSNSPPNMSNVIFPCDTASTCSSNVSSKPSSGANTPVRKISAQEFEKGSLRPMVSSVDGTPSFLGPSIPMEHYYSGKSLRKSRSELKALDERELMYELVMDICHDLDVDSLCHKILQNVSMLLNADRCSLFLAQSVGDPDKRCLVSKLFDVNSNSTLEECLEKSVEICIKWGVGITGYVAKTGEPVNIPDAYKDQRFNAEIDKKTGYKTRSILSMPIKDKHGEVMGVAQAINKTNVKDGPFNEHDEKVFASYLGFCGIGICNAKEYGRSLLEIRRNQLLLDLARVIFESQSNVADLIHKIMMHTQSLLRCERCQVLLVDESCKKISPYVARPQTHMGLFSQVFDLQASDFDNDDSYHREGNLKPRFPINIGITGYVSATGETLNIPDAYEDDKFDSSVDENTDFRTKSILCMPIKNAQGHVIGVAQLINKLDGTPFNTNDENLFEAFAIFCGLGITNTQMYEKAVKATAKQRIALEVLSYHAAAPMEEVHKMTEQPIPSAQQYRLFDYGLNDISLDDDATLKACVRMFLDTGLIARFHISNEIFFRWLLSVKKNYRAVAYHNWRHAFNVAQTMFCMITKGGLMNILGELECLALLVGCLCHDLDHRGTNNQFQIKTSSALSQLYSTSTMEHHHFDQCVMIINTKGNDILCNLTTQEYERVINIVENAILATDLALYFKYRDDFFEMVDKGTADWGHDDHRDLLRSMMMTACDVACISKPWEVQKRVAELIYDEFFEQGDLEKTELKKVPDDMMNREKRDMLPKMQVGFIDSICTPVYQSFAKMTDAFKPLLDGCLKNRQNWLELVDNQDKSEENLEKDEKYLAIEKSHSNADVYLTNDNSLVKRSPSRVADTDGLHVTSESR